MEQNILPLKQLSISSRQWSARVILVEKTAPRTSRSTGNSFQRYIFVDHESTRIQGISYGRDTEVVSRVLQLLETYIVSNARVTACSPEFRLVEHPFQWILSPSTVMELVSDSALPRSLGTPEFTPFSQLDEYKGTTNNIDVLAIVIDQGNKRTIMSQHGDGVVQDYVLITAEKIPVILCLWNDFIDTEGAAIRNATTANAPFPIIAATRVRVQTFRGLSLSAKGFANIVVNPEFEAATELQTWAMDNHSYLLASARAKSYFTSAPSSSPATNKEYSSVAAVLTTEMDGRFTVKGQVKFVTESQQFYYMACPTCYKRTTATADKHFTCHFCQKKAVATPRAKYTVLVYDSLTQMDVVIFGDLAEQLIGRDAVYFMTQATTGTPICIEEINAELGNKILQIDIRKKRSNNQDEHVYYYNLVGFSILPDQLPTATTSTAAATASLTHVATPPPLKPASNKRESPTTVGVPKAANTSANNAGTSHSRAKSARISSAKLLERLVDLSDEEDESNAGAANPTA